jgi:hypothetical protein
LRKDTNGSGDTEEDGVVVGLGQAVVLEEDTRVLLDVSGLSIWRIWIRSYSINVGVWVLGLAVLGENARSNLVNL